MKGHRLRSDGPRSRGAADGTRTRNRQLGRLLLYQLNYRRRCQDNFYRSEGPFSELSYTRTLTYPDHVSDCQS